LITRCRIVHNVVGSGFAGVDDFYGAGILQDCEISYNRALANDSIGGGGHFGSQSQLIRCVISHNKAGGPGGGLLISNRNNCLVENCVIAFNRVRSRQYYGGGVYIRGSTARPLFRNCTFYGNQAPLGSAVYAIHSSIIPGDPAEGTFVNCVLIDSPTDEFALGENAAIHVQYSNVWGGWPGEGNIDADPLFRDPENDDFRLRLGSPCIDSASTSGPDRDLDGAPRPMDIPGVGRDGPGAFDMGAYEYPSAFRNSLADINRDGKVDALDLHILLEDWKKVSGP